MIPEFTQDEITKISGIIMDNKFVNFSRIPYITETYDILHSFSNCMRMLIIIKSECGKRGDIDLSNKINNSYNSMSFFDEVTKYLILLNNDNIYNKHRIYAKLDDLYIKYKTEIDELNTFIYNLGKIIKQYDPEEHGGIV